MKRILTYLGVLLPLLTFGGCQTQEQKTETESKFEQDLRGLYTKVQTITSQAQTRSIEGEFVPLTEAELTEIFTEIADISERNGIPEKIAQVGVYADVRNGEMPFNENWDIYDCLNWLEQNSTPELMNVLFNLLSGENISLENIFNNRYIRDDEKLALVSTVAIQSNIMLSSETRASNVCTADYNYTVSNCHEAHKVWSYISAGVGVIHWAVGLAAFAVGELGLKGCLDTARAVRDECYRH